MILKIMIAFHESITAIHLGVSRTLAHIKQYFIWKNMDNDVRVFVKICTSCQPRKNEGNKRKAPLQNFADAKSPDELLIIDTVFPFVKSNRCNTVLFKAICKHANYLILIPLPDQKEETIARAMVERIFLKSSIPSKILSDNGKAFCSSLIKYVCKIFKVEQLHSKF
jgi:hypothetical protein